ncbi:axoneme-associated protein mst101(2)-like [Engraulis encrasicolus]|uniref:axoneme-associated protein mst101(2)-like n=1 Tax=Engraulis encrasicolus TaxID=184585 RepID=UPI002FD2D929
MELQENSWMRLVKLVFQERARTEAIMEAKMQELHSIILAEVELKLSSFKRMVIEQERRAGPEFSSLGHISWAMTLDDQAKLRRWEREEEELRWMRMQQMRPAQKQAWSPQPRVEVKPSDTEARLREELAAREQQELKARMKALEDSLKLMEDCRRDMKDLVAKTKEQERWEAEREKALEEERKRVENEKQEREKEESRKEMEREAKMQEKKLEEMKQREIEVKQKEEAARKALEEERQCEMAQLHQREIEAERIHIETEEAKSQENKLKEMTKREIEVAQKEEAARKALERDHQCQIAESHQREIEAERLLIETEKKRLERQKKVLKQKVEQLQRNEGKMAWEHETERKRLEREMRDLKQEVEVLQRTNEAREYEARKEKQNFERAKREMRAMKMQREKQESKKKRDEAAQRNNCDVAYDSDDSYYEDSWKEEGKEQRPEVTTISASAINTAVVRKPRKATLTEKPADVSRAPPVKSTTKKANKRAPAQEEDEDSPDDSDEVQPISSGTKTAVTRKPKKTTVQQKPDVTRMPPVKSTAKEQSAQEEDEDSQDNSHEEWPSPSGNRTVVAQKLETATSPPQESVDAPCVPPMKSTAKKAKKRGPAKEKDENCSDGSDEKQASPNSTKKTAVTRKAQTVTSPTREPANVSHVPVEGSAAKQESATCQEEDESSPWDSDEDPNPQTASKSKVPRVPPVNTAITSRSKPVGAPHIQKAPVPVQQHTNVSSGPVKGNTGAIEKPVKALTDEELVELELQQFDKELTGNSSHKKPVVASNTQKAAVSIKQNTSVKKPVVASSILKSAVPVKHTHVPIKGSTTVKKPVKALTDDDLFDLELEQLDKELNSSSSNKKTSMASTTQKASMVGGDTKTATTSMKQGSMHSMQVEKNRPTYGKAPASDIFDPWSDEECHSTTKTQTQKKTTPLSHMDKVDTFAMERELERRMNNETTTAKKWGHQDVKKPQALLKNTVPTNLEEVDTFAMERELERLNKQNEKEEFERRANELLKSRRSVSGSSLTGGNASSSFTSARAGGSLTGMNAGSSFTGARAGSNPTGVNASSSFTGARAGSSLTGGNASSSFTGARAGSSLTSVRTGSSLGGIAGQSNTNLGLKQPAYMKYLNRDR